MKQIGVEELKRLQLDILSYFDEFCKNNSIRYWIDYGTLLGAIRHKGFIPWDDDIDITMLRNDYNRAAELFNKQTDGRYVFQTPFNNKKARYPFGKLIDTKTLLYEYGEAGIKTGVYIDVFVYDNAPSKKEERDRIFRKRDFLGRIRRLQLPMREGIGKGKKVAYLIGSTILRLIPANYINKALDRNARINENVETGMVSTFVDPYDPTYFVVPKKTFQDQIEVEFEGYMFPAPRDYDFWLKELYGDYMELPPVEKRVHQHTFKAYYLDD